MRESKPAGQPAVHCGHTLKVIQMIITRVPGLTGCVQAHNQENKTQRAISASTNPPAPASLMHAMMIPPT